MKLTLLTEDQIWESTALPVIQALGSRVPATDFALIMGAETRESITTPLHAPACATWTISAAARAHVRTVGVLGQAYYFPSNHRSLGVRPVLTPQETVKIKPESISFIQFPNRDSIAVATYGQYPQTIAPRDIVDKLQNDLYRQKLKLTGHSYTYDPRDLTCFESGPLLKSAPEYIFEGQTYIRLKSKVQGLLQLSDGQKTFEGKISWVQVQPVKWLMDPTGYWVATHALTAGLQFNLQKDYDGVFNHTDMHRFLNGHMAKELAPHLICSHKKIRIKSQENQRG